MTQINLNQRIGEIVAELPEAVDVFKRYQIDFCCGGNRSLSEAIEEQKLDPDEVLNQLAIAAPVHAKTTVDYRTMSSGELIDYIVHQHHGFLYHILPELSELTTKILRVHCHKHPDILFKIHSLFHQLKTELEQHLIKEEEFLFPMIKEFEQKSTVTLRQSIEQYLAQSETEHDTAGKILKELRQLTDDYQVPTEGCATYRLTYRKLEELESDLFQHIHLENNILFKRSLLVS
ncbi:MAG TPA: iron-sulfur cluster repair di-iron protein [Bacillota bacterium]|nr:iron-sulfur cluster repair di-iron protein [Bacillota bacterium]